VALETDEIHVWRAWLDQPDAGPEDMMRVLSRDERQRAGRYRFQAGRQRFVTGRAILRILLGRYLHMEPRRVPLAYGPHGKPLLAPDLSGSGLEFNLAHAGPLALYAFARDRTVGVDVEQVRSLPDADAVAARFFSARENAAYSSLAADSRQLAFFQCWTRKEAFIKALGDGLAHPLDTFDVSLAPAEPAQLLYVASDPLEASRWSLISLVPQHDYVAALATPGHAWRLACWSFAHPGRHAGRRSF
jgi:4'-phosphopantetheinyl transferase